jgi:hypothetical protein
MQDIGWESKVRAALDNDKLSYLGAVNAPKADIAKVIFNTAPR